MRTVTKITSVTWTSDNKDRVLARFFFDDETTEVISVPTNEEGNEYWQEILKHQTIEEIDTFTAESKRQAEREIIQNIERDREANEVKKASALFNAKVEAFDIPEVIAAPKELKARIRKASSATQVMGLVAVCIMKSLEEKND